MWELFEFRRVIRKQCSRNIITKQVGCSLLYINKGICRVYTFRTVLACMAGTCWLDHQRSHWPGQHCMTQTAMRMNCSWIIPSKVLGTNSPFTLYQLNTIVFQFSLFISSYISVSLFLSSLPPSLPTFLLFPVIVAGIFNCNHYKKIGQIAFKIPLIFCLKKSRNRFNFR